MSRNEWPTLDNVSVVIGGPGDMTDNDVLGMVLHMAWAIAAQSVYTMTDPRPDPRIDDDRAHLVAMCSRQQFQAARSQINEFFHLRDGAWRLRDHSIIRLSRDGQRCVYCGTEEGTFHFDHLWPVSKGGSEKANNIVLACEQCNLSKGGKTLQQWMASR
jgi:hypothetical protein